MNIGNVSLDNKVFLSPMAGVTDLPFRLICKQKGCGMLLYRNDKCKSPLL